VELGIDVLHPVQTTANDLPEARRVTSGRLTLAGAIDGQRVLPFGTPEDVRREVFNKLDLLWEGGGYLPMAEKQLGVPEANLEAMADAIRDWSRRNVES
jgi:uroporphyrinogen-III decarboxylase